MAADKDESSGFKVVDRRSFTSEGARRKDAEFERQEIAEPQRPATPPRPQASSPRESGPRSDREASQADFETLVSYLSTTAMFQLGLIPGPTGERIPVDIPNAQRTIDLLEVLQQKTDGNLSADEAQLLEDVLYDLRMAFVEIRKQSGQKRK